MTQIKFSVIIPVGRNGTEKKIRETVRKNDFPQDRIEIVLVYGEELPGEKRNKGAVVSKGEYLIFIDDDVELERDYFSKLEEILEREAADVVGGPNCGPEFGNDVQRMIEIAFQSRLGFGKGAERFRNSGRVMKGNEDILTSCNLCIKRSAFANIGGFDKKLFPGEEVELIRRLRLEKYHLMYYPQLQVVHHRRASLNDLWKQVFHYGRGRADLIAQKGFKIRDISYLAPACLVFYTCFMTLKVLLLPVAYITGLLAYITMISAYCIKESVSKKLKIKDMATLFAVFVTIHFSYGCGMLSKLKRRREVDDGCR